MQKFKEIDGANPDGTANDNTKYQPESANDNWFNVFDLVENEGYILEDDDTSQLTKAVRGLYNPTTIYNTSSIATQTVSDIARGSDGAYYQIQNDGVAGDNPVGSVTGNWKKVPLDNFTNIVRDTTTVNFTTDANITISNNDNDYGRLVITDTGVVLSASREVNINDIPRRFILQNDTTQDLDVKVLSSSGSTVTVPSSNFKDLYSDGNNIKDLSALAEIATATEIRAGTDNEKVITPLGYNLTTLGWGQTWQEAELINTGATFTDGTPSFRQSGITYTNTSGRPIAFWINSSSLNVNTVTIDTLTFAIHYADPFMIVPNGSTYSISGTIDNWYEFR